MADEFRVLRPREYHDQLVLKGQRVDGRGLSDARDVKLETNAIKTADSSVLVKLGNTSLVCGCIATTEPTQAGSIDLTDCIRLKVELPPICSGPTGQKMQQTSASLERSLRSILRDSKCIDEDTLLDGDQTWKLDVEVICLNYDGSLLDASLIAVLAALLSLKISSNFADRPRPEIKLNCIPLTLSFATIGQKTICDPNLEEETVSTSTFTVTIDPATDKCCHISKIGGKPISYDSLVECIQLARQRAFKLRKLFGISEKQY